MWIPYHHRAPRGQTILELIGVTTAIALFLGLSYYLAAVFSVAHQQTMLNRTQAFMELGNYSYYGFSKHGEDDPKKEQSRVVFLMGKKSSGTVVKFEDQEEFKEATEGELELDIYDGPESAVYWRKFSFPKGITDVRWMGDYDRPMFQIRLLSVLAIAHNRSLKLDQGFSNSSFDETGLYSGSIHFNQYTQVANLMRRKGFGLVDNVDLIKDLLRELVRDDPSLSDEAADLERNLNLSESITGGGVSSLVSLAISAISAWGFEKLNAAMAKEGAAAASSGSGAAKSVTDALGNPIHATTRVASGTFGGSLADFMLSPLYAFQDGLAHISGGLGGLASEAATSTDLFRAMYGASQIGDLTNMGFSATGKTVPGLTLANAALALPYGIKEGFAAVDNQLNNNRSVAEASRNWVGAIQAIPKVVTPVTRLAVAVAPDAALAVSYINAGMSAASALAGIPGSIGELGSGRLTESFDVLSRVGALTASIGGLYSDIAYLSGGDGKIGGYLQMAGGSLVALSEAGRLVSDLEKQNLNVFEGIGKEIAGLPDRLGANLEKNVDDFFGRFKQFGEDSKEAWDSIGNGLADFMNPSKLDDGGFAKSLANLSDDVYPRFGDKPTEQITTDNLKLMQQATIEMNDKLPLWFAAHGNEDVRFELDIHMANIDDAVFALNQAKNGVPVTPEMMLIFERGKNSAAAVHSLVKDRFAQPLNDRYHSQSQLRGIMAGNDQLAIVNNLIKYDMDYKDAVKMELEYKEQRPLAYFLESFSGGEMSNRNLQHQIDAAEALARLSTKKFEIPKGFKGDPQEFLKKFRDNTAKEILTRAEAISEKGYIVTDSTSELREGAGLSAQVLRDYLADESIKHDPNTKLRMGAAIRKLEALSSGERPVETGAQTIDRISQALAEREARFQRIKSSLLKCNAGLC